jgi:hypothetical protein
MARSCHPSMNAPAAPPIPPVSTESRRVRQLRSQIIKDIPRFPNDRATLQELEQKSLASLLIVYLNWAKRYVPPRRRSVVIEPTLTADSRWKALAPRVRQFLDKVSAGADLTPHLSLRAKRNGYTSTNDATAPSDRWEDKDFLLITMGYHHFHLGPQSEHSHTDRTDDVLFAQVTRDTFYAIGLFNHSVFATASSMTAERERMWTLYDRRSSFGRPPGIYLAAGPVTTSGHSLHDVRMAQDYVHVIREIDPKLDELQARSSIFTDLSHHEVKAMKVRWHFNYQDFGLLDRPSHTFFILRKGSL